MAASFLEVSFKVIVSYEPLAFSHIDQRIGNAFGIHTCFLNRSYAHLNHITVFFNMLVAEDILPRMQGTGYPIYKTFGLALKTCMTERD